MQTIWYEVYVSGVWGLVYVVCFVCCVLHHRVWCVMCVACGVICLVCGVLGSVRCSCFTSWFCLGCLNVSFLDVCLNASFPCRWQRRWCVVFWTRIVSLYVCNVLYNVIVFTCFGCLICSCCYFVCLLPVIFIGTVFYHINVDALRMSNSSVMFF